MLALSYLTLDTHGQTVVDIDGNSYNTIAIGTQVWMKENLKSTRFNNGDIISTTTEPVNNEPATLFQWPYNNDSLNLPSYGRLYTWYVVSDDRNVCPVGWHVPSETELIDLVNFLGGDSIAGDKMKEIGTTHWSTTTSSVSNSSNFTGLPGGLRGNPTGFGNLGTLGCFWTSTPWGINSFPRAVTYALKSNSSALEQSVAVANCGFSIRCLEDMPLNIGDVLLEDAIHVFPNPTDGKLNISCPGKGTFTATIFNSSGNRILQKSLNDKMNLLDLSFLSQGQYTLKIEFDGQTVVRKIVINE